MDVLTLIEGDTSPRWDLRRYVGCAVGVAVHVLFAYTVWRLFWFLKNGPGDDREGSLFIDAVLALQFALPHSALLHPAVKRRLGRWVSPAFYGLFYTTVTCVSLLLLFACWRSVGPTLWRATGPMGAATLTAFFASWLALFYSLHLTGLGFQTGLTPWLAWVRGQPQPRRAFKPQGAYRWLRHPVYLSFMGLVWFTPTMTLDHAVLTGIWTVYLLLGSWLKDRRLEHYVGEPYREYETQVPGYPLAVVGPLGKRKKANSLVSLEASIGRAA
ncbi:NnrU protein [Botrimarina colliarenosi]|uniref:NnrU protein n=1 Tax=Botrimarina colliarenosi TaxID=2528001 RepID=A0A5C6AAS9_9BACT|nr:NnrU family protein [Botrimarina colliarenosi]TWT95433.1 NnrU protein [Botrimarina colliarenosi]